MNNIAFDAESHESCKEPFSLCCLITRLISAILFHICTSGFIKLHGDFSGL